MAGIVADTIAIAIDLALGRWIAGMVLAGAVVLGVLLLLVSEGLRKERGLT